MSFTTRPIDHYPGTPSKNRVSSPFNSTYGATLKLLERELRALHARGVVLMADIQESDLRLDGEIRANANIGPRVVVAFEGRVNAEWVPLKYACDRFYRWQDNVRAIALGLEALRKVERYGIATRGEQYTGWKALGSGLAIGARQVMTTAEALRVINDLSESRYDRDDLGKQSTRDDMVTAFRTALKRHHPDQGGSAEAVAALLEARKVLLGE